MASKRILQFKGGQYTITVPKHLAEAKGWEKGDVAYWSDAGRNSLVLSKEEK